MHWCPPFTCKFIAIGIFTRWMKNRNAHTPIRINWQFKIMHCQKTWSNHRHEYQSTSNELTIWMPHLRSKSHRWRAVGIILREGHYCIEVASVTAKNKSLPLDENPGTFFHEHAKIHSMHKPSDKRENHTSTRTHKKTHVRLHIHAHVWHTHTHTFIFEIHTS